MQHEPQSASGKPNGRRGARSPEGEAIARLLEPFGQQTELAARLGVLPSAVSKWIAKGVLPPQRVLDLEALAKQLGIDIDLPALRALTRRKAAAGRATIPA